MTDLALYRACLSALETLEEARPKVRMGHLIGELRERVAREKAKQVDPQRCTCRRMVEVGVRDGNENAEPTQTHDGVQ